MKLGRRSHRAEATVLVGGRGNIQSSKSKVQGGGSHGGRDGRGGRHGRQPIADRRSRAGRDWEFEISGFERGRGEIMKDEGERQALGFRLSALGEGQSQNGWQKAGAKTIC